jgi:hypothetical protein
MTVIFGKPWDAPLCEGAAVGITPIGEPCGWCTLPIEDGDSGVIIPCVAASGIWHSQPWHCECQLSSIFRGAAGVAMTPQEVRAAAVEMWNRLTAPHRP